ncbi:MAG: hydroxymethylbilane synthase, partial [Thermodesulfobacteriota bacterium]
MTFREIRIGTRGSPLALYQANWVKDHLIQCHPDLKVTLIKIKTTGDKFLDAPLAKIGGKGLFVKEIEEALHRKEIDLAVHSIKDVPTELPEGLHLSVVTKREDPRDAFISKDGTFLKDLPEGAKIGTSSLRRQVQLLHLRSDFQIIPLRGNLDTRLRKLRTENFEGVVIALAGLKRLGLEMSVTEILSSEVFLPAIGQGALGIETRIGDKEIEEKIQFLNDPQSSIAIRAERAFLRRLGGGCQVPMAAFGRIENSILKIDGMVGNLEGRSLVRDHIEGPTNKA